MKEREQMVHDSIQRRIREIKNRKLANELDEFTKALRIGNGIQPVKIRTIQGYLDVLTQVMKMYPKKCLMELTKSDLVDYISSREDRGLANVSINLHKIRIKRCLTWFYHDRKLCGPNEVPDLVSWVQISKKIPKTKGMGDVLSPSEIQMLVNATDNLRDKCLISVGYEGGFRISELLDIKIKDITLNENYAFVLVSGKTGSRRNIMIDSYPHLKAWLNNHPFKNDREQYLFIAMDFNTYGKQLWPFSAGALLRRLAKRVGINKRVACHTAFRHSRLTYLASVYNWNEPKLRKFAGWSTTSQMTDVYCHGTEKDVYDSLLMEAGIIPDKESIEALKEKEALKPKLCPKCSHLNPAGSLYCNCGLCLNYDEAQEIENKKNEVINQATKLLVEMMSDPEKMARFMKFKEIQS